MGFLTNLFGKKNKENEVESVGSAAEQTDAEVANDIEEPAAEMVMDAV